MGKNTNCGEEVIEGLLENIVKENNSLFHPKATSRYEQGSVNTTLYLPSHSSLIFNIYRFTARICCVATVLPSLHPPLQRSLEEDTEEDCHANTER